MSTIKRNRCGGRIVFLLALLAALPAASPRAELYGQNAVTAPPSASEAFTLSMAVETGLRSNPLLRAAASGREIADSRMKAARAGRRPQIQAAENISNGNNPVFVFGSLLEQSQFGSSNFNLNSLNSPDPLTNFRSSVTLKQSIFDQGQTATRVASGQLELQQVEAQTDQVAQQVRFETLRAFYGLLLAQARKALSDEDVRFAGDVVRRSRDRVDAGTAVRSEFLNAEVQLAEARQEQIESKAGIAIAEAELSTAMGLPLNANMSIAGQFSEKSFDPVDQEQMIRLALEHRPDLIRAGLAVQSGELEAKGARNQYQPRVDVFANVGASHNTTFGGSSDYVAGVNVTLDLFSASRAANIDETRAAADLASSQRDNLSNQIRLDVVRACQQFGSARERLSVTEHAIAQAEETLRIMDDRYQEGLTTTTEVLRTETALTRARFSALKARHDYDVGFARILLATGRLTDIQLFIH